MGGDRDGNPNVTAEVTKKVILFSRWQAAKLYEKELTKLIQDLINGRMFSKKLNNSWKNI